MFRLSSLRRLFRFRLRTLFVLLTLACVGGGWFLHRVQRQREAVAWVKNNGHVTYDIETRSPEPLRTQWLREKLGIDFVARPVSVNLSFVTDLEPLRELPTLESVWIDNSEVKDLAPLARMPQLKELHLQHADVLDVTAQLHCPRLRELEGNFRRLDSLAPFRACGELQMVWLHESQVKSLAGVEAWPQLYLLNVAGPIEDLSPLAACPHLSHLSLHGLRVRDFSPLGRIKNLDYLFLADADVERFELPPDCRELRSLSLHNAGALDLSMMTHLSKLQDLSAPGNPTIDDLEPLRNFLQLRNLNLSGTKVRDLTPLAGLNQLARLDLNGAPVEDLAPLAALIGLHSLQLPDTKVFDVTPLAGLKNLQFLSLRNTAISDVTPLMNLAAAKYMDLTGTHVSQADVDALRKALPQCKITANNLRGP